MQPDQFAPVRYRQPRFVASEWFVAPTLRELAISIGGQIALGIVAGVVWLKTAPGTVSYVLGDAQGRPYILPAENENWIAGDGRFAAFTVVAGLVAGVAWWWLRRLRGPSGIGVLIIGSVAGALTARLVGESLSHGHTTGPLRTAIHPPLVLHASPVLLLWAFVALLVYTMIAGLSTDHTLGHGVSTLADGAVLVPSGLEPGASLAGSAGTQTGAQGFGADGHGVQG